MNETVKAALLNERRSAIWAAEAAEIELNAAHVRVTRYERLVAERRQCVADFDAALTEAGVDLAAEDAKAAERSASSDVTGQARNDLLSQYGQTQSAINGDLGQRYATIGLATRLDG